jgi:hypothetical protein
LKYRIDGEIACVEDGRSFRRIRQIEKAWCSLKMLRSAKARIRDDLDQVITKHPTEIRPEDAES